MNQRAFGESNFEEYIISEALPENEGGEKTPNKNRQARSVKIKKIRFKKLQC